METTEDVTNAEAIAHAAAMSHGPLFIDLTGLAVAERADGGIYDLRCREFGYRLIAKAERHTDGWTVRVAWSHADANLFERGQKGRDIGQWMDEEISDLLCDSELWDFTEDCDEEE